MSTQHVENTLASIAKKLAIVRSAVSKTRATLSLDPCVTEPELAVFEKRYRVTLPNEYRMFLLKMGNGGAGPDYGLLPLKLDWGHIDPPFTQPFPVSTDLAIEVIARPLPKRFLDGFGDDFVPGCVDITEAGCGTGATLVLTGEQRGIVWYRGGVNELIPCHDENGDQLGFLSWYGSWLDQWLTEIANCRPDSPANYSR
jgi:hypothetical protein